MRHSLTVLVVTYNRPFEIRKTIEALNSHIIFDGDIKYHIADDGSSGYYVRDIVEYFNWLNIESTITNRGGWGKNVNNAMSHINDEYIFIIEDDYVCKNDLDFNKAIDIMEYNWEIGLFRFDGLEGHNLILELKEQKTGDEIIPYFELKKDSPCLNVYSNRPHLVHKNFHLCYGPYVEGKKLGETEDDMAWRVKNNKHGLKICSLVDYVYKSFDHIGISYQLTKEDIHD